MIADYAITQDEFANIEGQDDMQAMEASYYVSKVNEFVMNFFGISRFFDYEVNQDLPRLNRNERNTLKVPAASDQMYQRERNRWERLKQATIFVEDLKAKWKAGHFFFTKVIKRVEGGEYINEELLTVGTPKDFYKPSQRIKILNADRHPSLQLEDIERVI